jgi:hypothetical protein
MKQILQHEMKLNNMYILELTNLFYLIYLKERLPTKSLRVNIIYLMGKELLSNFFILNRNKKLFDLLTFETLNNSKFYKLNNWLKEYPLRIVK